MKVEGVEDWMTSGRNGRVSRVAMALVFAGIGVIGAASLVGCQTTKGAGEDIENLGDNISDTAENASD